MSNYFHYQHFCFIVHHCWRHAPLAMSTLDIFMFLICIHSHEFRVGVTSESGSDGSFSSWECVAYLASLCALYYYYYYFNRKTSILWRTLETEVKKKKDSCLKKSYSLPSAQILEQWFELMWLGTGWCEVCCCYGYAQWVTNFTIAVTIGMGTDGDGADLLEDIFQWALHCSAWGLHHGLYLRDLSLAVC